MDGVGGWVDGWIVGWVDGWVDGRGINGCADELMGG